MRSLHEKRLVPRGGKPVILWPLFVPCEQRFISGMAFSTCGVVYSVSVIRLVGFFSTNYNSINPPGPSCTKVLYIMGPVSLAFLWKHFIGEFSLFVFKWSIQSSNCRQKESNWIHYLSFYIWIQILHYPGSVKWLTWKPASPRSKFAFENRKREVKAWWSGIPPHAVRRFHIKASRFISVMNQKIKFLGKDAILFYLGLMTLIELVFMTWYSERHKPAGHLQ